MLADLLSGKKLRTYVIEQYAEVVILPIRFIQPLLETASDILSLRGVHRHSEVAAKIVKGILMAVPVLLIFMILFSSADLLFEKYVSGLLTLNISVDTLARLARTAIIGAFFLGAFSFMAGRAKQAGIRLTGFPLKLGVLEVSIFLGAINVLFLLFILIQLVYLFGGADNVTSQGFTYAEYARRGFFELIAVAVFSFLILWKTEQSLPRNERAHHSNVFKTLSAIHVVELLIIMFSAFTRLSLYESAYGFTTLRFFSHAFIVFLCAVFLILLWKITVDARDEVFAHRIFLSIVAFVVCMNLLNPDAFIARQNIKQFAATPEKLDAHYLSTLSEDALPEIIDLRFVADTLVLDNEERGIFYGSYLYEDHRLDESASWQSMNIARLRARQLLEFRQRQRYYK